MYAVSGLSYPSYYRHSYKKTVGACHKWFYYHRALKVSEVTCRFLCDTAPQRRYCYGYTYFSLMPEETRLGLTVSTCIFLREACKFVGIRKRLAYTYFTQKAIALLKSNLTSLVRYRPIQTHLRNHTSVVRQGLMRTHLRNHTLTSVVRQGLQMRTHLRNHTLMSALRQRALRIHLRNHTLPSTSKARMYRSIEHSSREQVE